MTGAEGRRDPAWLRSRRAQPARSETSSPISVSQEPEWRKSPPTGGTCGGRGLRKAKGQGSRHTGFSAIGKILMQRDC